jgi:hypothetical protein
MVACAFEAGASGLGCKTVRETCSESEFKEALDFLTSPASGQDPNEPWKYMNATPAIPPQYNTQQVLDRYRDFHAPRAECCAVKTDLNWPPTQRRMSQKEALVINVAEGSTATRFLDCIYDVFGYNTAHGEGKLRTDCTEESVWAAQNRNGSLQHVQYDYVPCKYHTNTKEFDQYDYVSDTPVAYHTDHLLVSHPDSPVLLGTRDPRMWQQRRRGEHLKQGSAKWVGASPCGVVGEGFRQLSHPDAWEDFVIYNAWVACVVPSDRLFVYNLFGDNLDAQHDIDIVQRLKIFMDRHTSLETFTSTDIPDAVDQCRSRKTSALKTHHHKN